MSTSSAEATPATEPTPPRRPRMRTWGFAILVLLLVATATGYVGWARARDKAETGSGGAVITSGAPALLFQNLARTGSGRVAVAPLSEIDDTRRLAGLNCDRVHFGAGRGLCLTAGSQFPPRPQAMIFGSDFQVTKKIRLDGIPSRARVSGDGRYGATTSFVTGHSYSDNSFSTSTILIDMAKGTTVANLEKFTIMRNGRPYTARDANFWGVTFAADSNRFYATLATGGRTYLVEGDIAARRVVVGRENVECPSLSPDGTLIGFKKRVDQGSASPRWRFHVLDLASGQETPLAETRSIDDQLEWLDNDILLYGSFDTSNAVMSVPADGTGEPRRLVSQAASPAVLRTPRSDPAPSGLVPGPQLGRANLGITISAPEAVVPGESVVQTITVTNHGPDAATNVFVEDQLSGPGRIASAEAIPSTGGSYGCAVIGEENRARCDVAELPAGVVWTITITVTATGPGSLDGKASVIAAEPDPQRDDDFAVARTTSR